MYIVRNKRKKGGKIYTYTFLAESCWDGKKSRKKILANLSSLSPKTIHTLELSLKGKENLMNLEELMIEKSIDYGQCLVILEIMKRLKIDQVIKNTFREKAELAILMIIGKIITRGSKLGIVNWIKREEIIANKIGVNIEAINEKKLYAVMEDLDSLQEKIEHKWSVYNKKRQETIYLYDITSFYFEGTENELAAYGYNRDKKKGKKIITAGLITDSEGFPLKIKVFEGNMQDSKTVEEVLKTIKTEYESKEIIMVGDRGMRIRYNLENMEDAEIKGISYISGLTTDEIRKLEKNKVIQLSFFDKDLKEVEYEGKRYVLCLNLELAKEKTEKRSILKTKFEEELIDIKKKYEKQKKKCKTNKQRLAEGDKNKKLKVEIRDEEIESWKYNLRKAQVKYKMQKVYQITIDKDQFKIEYDPLAYEELGKYDGKYVFETTVSKDKLNKEEVRDTYKRLQKVEHIFRDMKTSRLDIRPIFHRKAEQTRAHALIGMFAYAVIHEMEKKIFPWLKEMKKTKDKLSFTDVIEELKNIKLSVLSFGKNTPEEIRISKLNDHQKKILNLLKINDKILT